jgi:hypothetical protein
MMHYQKRADRLAKRYRYSGSVNLESRPAHRFFCQSLLRGFRQFLHSDVGKF